MTTKPLTALDDAIRDYIAAETDGEDTVVHWVLAAGLYSGDADDGSPIYLAAPDGQPTYVSDGLLHTALTVRDTDD